MAYESITELDGPKQHHHGKVVPSPNNKQSDGPSNFQPFRATAVKDAGKIFGRRKSSQKTLKWVLINLMFALIFHNGVFQQISERYTEVTNKYIVYIDYFLSFVFLWNTLVNLYVYLLPSIKNETVVVSPEQKRLLKISDNDKSFVLKKHVTEQIQTTPTTRTASWPKRRQTSQTTPSGTIVRETTPERGPNRFTPSMVQDFRTSQSPSTKPSNRSFETTPTTSPMRRNTSSTGSLKGLQSSPGRSPVMHDGQITNSDSLDRYLKTQEDKEAISRRVQMEGGRSTAQSFWNYGRGALDFIPTFGAYQLATRSPQSSNLKDDDISQSSFDYETLWKQLSINRGDLDLWTENLRKWIAETILEKLVAEITNINRILLQNGCSELQIGSVSVSSLRNVAISKSQIVPSLKSVIPYLEVTANQEYLISRLEELSTGGCLRLYKWDSGGSLKGKAWDQELPTDAQIIAHLFCTYMDTHLPSNPRYQDGNSFSGLHFLKPPSKQSDRKSDLCILQTRTHPPHFKVIEAQETHDVPRGRHNLFMAISMFLHLVKIKNHGMLERVNLGMSGINILWILLKK
eukprot:Seg4392.1 transcript_id=Seg4392.1/GoldUCD/mRNA.D3Y31 product="Transmembrane protein 209" protein_id=Seg4392.1/GoldUCD/D3Y31